MGWVEGGSREGAVPQGQAGRHNVTAHMHVLTEALIVVFGRHGPIAGPCHQLVHVVHDMDLSDVDVMD